MMYMACINEFLEFLHASSRHISLYKNEIKRYLEEIWAIRMEKSESVCDRNLTGLEFGEKKKKK